jgi:hypothetical protein
MATVDQIKQEIIDYYEEPSQPKRKSSRSFADAFEDFEKTLEWRRTEITLPSGIAKLVDLSKIYVVFSVGSQLFRVNASVDDGHKWEADDMYEVTSQRVDVIEYHKKDLKDSI